MTDSNMIIFTVGQVCFSKDNIRHKTNVTCNIVSYLTLESNRCGEFGLIIPSIYYRPFEFLEGSDNYGQRRRNFVPRGTATVIRKI